MSLRYFLSLQDKDEGERRTLEGRNLLPMQVLTYKEQKDFSKAIAWEKKKLWSIMHLRAKFLPLKRKLTFSSPVATAEFPKFAGILSAAL